MLCGAGFDANGSRGGCAGECGGEDAVVDGLWVGSQNIQRLMSMSVRERWDHAVETMLGCAGEVVIAEVSD
jgi:hypothetical protein